MKDLQPQGEIVLDGDIGEGGGSILRVAAGLAVGLDQKLVMRRIRANRAKPGLKMQHIAGVRALLDLTSGHSSPLKEGATELTFTPGSALHPSVVVAIQTAGNIGLLCQTIQNALVLKVGQPRPFSFSIRGGGSYGTFAPGAAFIDEVVFHLFRSIGYHCDLHVHQHGFYPKGGGQATLTIRPPAQIGDYRPFIALQRGKLRQIAVQIVAEGRLRKPQVAERIANAIRDSPQLDDLPREMLDIRGDYCHSPSVGVGIDAWAEFEPGIRVGIETFLGKRGLSSEKLGASVAASLAKMLNGGYTVDAHTADQILPILMLAGVPFAFTVPEISSHFSTNANIMRAVVGQSPTVEKWGELWRISHNYPAT